MILSVCSDTPPLKKHSSLQKKKKKKISYSSSLSVMIFPLKTILGISLLLCKTSREKLNNMPTSRKSQKTVKHPLCLQKMDLSIPPKIFEIHPQWDSFQASEAGKQASTLSFSKVRSAFFKPHYLMGPCTALWSYKNCISPV